MANYLVTDTELTSVADAIRTKGGTSADLEFPSGFVTAIGNISGGGSTLGTKTITANDTYDAQDDGYDGYSQVTVTVPTGTARTSADLTASGATVTAPAGLYAEAASKSVASGSATTPATTITANPSISVGSDGLITATASATQSVTPTVSAGYVSSGTAGTITVSGSATSQLTAQAAQTIHPSTSDQTIASGKYLTGAQTVKGVLLTNLDAGNIKKDVVIKVGDSTDDDCVTSVTGTYEGGGGGYSADDIASAGISGAVTITETKIKCAAFFGNAGITSINAPNATELEEIVFQRCTGVTSVNFPELVTIGWKALLDFGASTLKMILPKATTFLGPSHIDGVSSTSGGLFTGFHGTCIVLPAFTGGLPNWTFGTSTALTSVDLNCQSIPQNVFNGCTSLSTIVLRRSAGIASLGNVNSFTGTPFASGGSGGTIYIPKALYDHLGDGTALDYKAATNWSTINGYGTITWAKIEGSIYETQYADGTAISS